jgi:hypothetical protein
MSTYKFFLQRLGNSDDAERFGEWGFGRFWERQWYPQLTNSWNALHAPIPEIKDEQSFIDNFQKMIDVWRANYKPPEPDPDGDDPDDG